MFKSATFKLTMWYLAIVMTISLIFSSVLYSITTSELNRGIQRESERIELQYPVFNNDPRLQQSGPDISNGSHRILLRLVALNLFVLVGAGYVSYALARRTIEPIEYAHEQQKRFTSDVSHELRTPLTALRMESEVALLNPKSSSKELRSTIKSNLEEVTKLDTLINNLLRLSQLEANEMQQHFSTISSSDIIQNAVQKISKIAESRTIKITENISDIQLHGDQDSLTQAVVILLDNAIKYSPNKSEISVTTKKQKDHVVFQVSDEGKGIDPIALDHIFDRFYRSDSSRAKSSEDGYGLGLSIAKTIVELHNGTVVVESRSGKGTIATILIPIGNTQKDSDS